MTWEITRGDFNSCRWVQEERNSLDYINTLDYSLLPLHIPMCSLAHAKLWPTLPVLELHVVYSTADLATSES